MEHQHVKRRAEVPQPSVPVARPLVLTCCSNSPHPVITKLFNFFSHWKDSVKSLSKLRYNEVWLWTQNSLWQTIWSMLLRLGHTTFTKHGYILYILKTQINMYRHILGCSSAINMVVMCKGVACSTVWEHKLSLNNFSFSGFQGWGLCWEEWVHPSILLL